jgi:hypothetical protein
VTSYVASLPILLRHPLNNGIELAVFVANKWITPPLRQRLIFSCSWLNKTWQRRRLNTCFRFVWRRLCSNDLVNGQKMLVVTVYVSPNTSSDDWKSLIFSNLVGYSPKVCKMFKVLAGRGYEGMPIILVGDFNGNVKDNYSYNADLVEFIKDTFELDVFFSGLFQGTTRSNSCVDMVLGRNVDNLYCMKYVLYSSYPSPIFSRTNHQAPQLTDVIQTKRFCVISVNDFLYI